MVLNEVNIASNYATQWDQIHSVYGSDMESIAQQIWNDEDNWGKSKLIWNASQYWYVFLYFCIFRHELDNSNERDWGYYAERYDWENVKEICEVNEIDINQYLAVFDIDIDFVADTVSISPINVDPSQIGYNPITSTDSYTVQQVDDLLAFKADLTYVDATFYTQSTVDSLLSGKSNTGHTHDDRYYTETELNNGQLDNRYYTETEVDTLLSNYVLVTTLTSTLSDYVLTEDINTLTELNSIVNDATLITDAPSDGNQYVRQNGSWTQVIIPEGGSINYEDMYTTYDGSFTTSIAATGYVINISPVVIGGLTLTDEQLANGVLKIKDVSESPAEWKVVKLDKFTWNSGTGNLDITNCTDAFELATGDIVSLAVPGMKKGYDVDQDVNKVSVENELNPSIEILVDAVNTGDTSKHYEVINFDGYVNGSIQLIGTSDGSGVTFKVFTTLLADAAVPATGADPSSSWVSVSDEFLGNASGVTLNDGAIENKMIYIDTNIHNERLLIQYTPDHATNSSTIVVKKGKPSS